MAGTIERTLPRISLNKLGEYMTATPSRRRLIVRDQRRPKGFLLPRYNEAQASIVSYLIAERRDVGMVVDDLRRLATAVPGSAWEAQRNTLCAEALQAFVEMADQLPSEIRWTRAPQRPPLLNYGDVAVSVRPELIAQVTSRTAAPRVGAVKLYFSKTMPLGESGGAYVATALADFADELLGLEARPDPRLCLAIDVFACKIYRAARLRARRRADLQAACDEIARAWYADDDRGES